MADRDRPTQLQEPRSKADRLANTQPEALDTAGDVIEKLTGSDPEGRPEAIEAAAESDLPLRGNSESRREPSRESDDGSEQVDRPAGDPRPIRRKWILLAILAAVLVAGGIGGAALYLTEVREQNRTGVAIGELETRLAQQEAELAEQHGRIGELQAALEVADGRMAELQAALEREADRITELEAATPDWVTLEEALIGLQDSGESVMDELGRFDGALAALQDRLESVEAQPIPIGDLPEQIVSAYDRQLAEILGTVDERFVEMQESLNAGLAEIEAARTEAELSRQDARRSQDSATAREALARIVSALESGSAFATELGQLQRMNGLVPPDLLTSIAAEGVPTRAELSDAFPELARKALDAATTEAVKEGDIGPFRAFMQTQLGLRSLEPRDGDGPDAALSRAEAAARADDLGTALAEIATLPPSAQEQFADWIARAELRRGALDAVATVSIQLGNRGN